MRRRVRAFSVTITPMDNQMHNEPITEDHKPVPVPVMDIKPPVAADKPHSLPDDPAMSHSLESISDSHHSKKADQPARAVDKQPSNGTGGAIFATVIIVIVLAALATYAYLKTAK